MDVILILSINIISDDIAIIHVLLMFLLDLIKPLYAYMLRLVSQEDVSMMNEFPKKLPIL